MSSKKGTGSTKNGRDSKPKYLGQKLYDGQFASSGSIIFRQRGNKIWPGKNVGQAKDFSLFALVDGTVKYSPYKGFKTKVEVVSASAPIVKETKKTVSTPSSKSIVKKNHISTLDTKLEVFKKDVAKTVKSLKKEAKPIKIIGRTEDSEYYILDDGRQITRQEVVDEIDKKVNSFYVGGIENILISVHPKEDIVDYVRTKPNDKEHDNLTNLKAN